MITYTEEQLLQFSNDLFDTQKVITSHSVNEFLKKWKYIHKEKLKALPSGHQIGDSVWLSLWGNSIACEVDAVLFYTGKVKYNLSVFGLDGGTTRLYNVDSAFVTKTRS